MSQDSKDDSVHSVHVHLIKNRGSRLSTATDITTSAGASSAILSWPATSGLRIAGVVRTLLTLQFPTLVRAAAIDPSQEHDSGGLSGDEFSNNLFSDLAPLLALFGERVATQYLRHSTHALESVIFACAPLGIITAVTAAIRVGGQRNLKALIGRAEEAEAQAEIELIRSRRLGLRSIFHQLHAMTGTGILLIRTNVNTCCAACATSSTSTDVCELWNGVGLVRVVGKPQILEFIYDEALAERERRRVLISSTSTYGLYTRREGMRGETPNEDQEPMDFTNAPNISLNTIGRGITKLELYAIAFVGVVLQLGVLAFDWVATYHIRWNKGNNPVASYAFPLTCIGTLGIVLGMYLCACIVEKSTKETNWLPTDRFKSEGTPRIIWVQKKQTVGDQGFQSFAIYAPVSTKNGFLTTSFKHGERHRARFHKLTLIASILSFGAFVLQFVGLRAMHYSASIAQLIATAIMTMFRVVIRSHLSQAPKILKEPKRIPSHRTYSVQPLSEDFELDIIAMQLQECDVWQVSTYNHDNPQNVSLSDQHELAESADQVAPQSISGASEAMPTRTNPTSPTRPHASPLNSSDDIELVELPDTTALGQDQTTLSLAERVLGSRIRLGQLLHTPWQTDLLEHAVRLSETVTDITNLIWNLASEETPSLKFGPGVKINARSQIEWRVPVGSKSVNQELGGAPVAPEWLSLYLERRQVDGIWSVWDADPSRLEAILQLWMQRLQNELHLPTRTYSLWLLSTDESNSAMSKLVADWWIGRDCTILKDKTIIEICHEYKIVLDDGSPDYSRIIGYRTPWDLERGATRAQTQGNAADTPATIPRANQPESSTPEDFVISRAIIKNTTLVEMCTQFLLYCFLCEISGWLEKVTTPSRLIREGGRIELTNHVVGSLAREAHRRGLVGIDDAYSLVVSALEGSELLPIPNGFVHEVESLRQAIEARVSTEHAVKMMENFYDTAHGWWEMQIQARLRINDWRGAASLLLKASSRCGHTRNIATINNPENTTSQQLHNSGGNHVKTECPLQKYFFIVQKFANELSELPEHPQASSGPATDTPITDHIAEMGNPDFMTQHLFDSELMSDDQPWRRAMQSQHPEANVFALLKQGLDPNKADKAGVRPIEYAAYLGKNDVVILLLLYGTTLNDKRHTQVNSSIRTNSNALRGLPLWWAVAGAAERRSQLERPTMTDLDYQEVATSLTRLPGNTIATLNNFHTTEDTTPNASSREDLIYFLLNTEDDPLASILARKPGYHGRASASPFHLAASMGLTAIGEIFCEYWKVHCSREGLTIQDLLQAVDERGWSALHHAAEKGHTKTAKALLSMSQSLRASDVGALGPRIRRIGAEHPLQIGWENRQSPVSGVTALHLAAKNGHASIVTMLLEEAGAEAVIDFQDTIYSRTPLLWAAANGHTRIISLLLSKGAECDITDKDGLGPLQLAAKNGHVGAVNILGKDDSAKTEHNAHFHGRTALLWAITHGHADVIECLLKLGFPLTIQDAYEGLTPLHLAAKWGKSGALRMGRMFLDHGADVNSRDIWGRTPFHYAAGCGESEAMVFMKLLLQVGANAGTTDNDLKTPFHHLAGASLDILDGIMSARVILDANVSTEAADNNGSTALHIAVGSHSEGVVTALLGGGADVMCQDSTGKTPLHLAAGWGNLRLVQKLLKKVTNFEVKDNSGSTAVLAVLSAMENHTFSDYKTALELLELLMSYGAQIHAKNNHGMTGLHYAARSGCCEVVRWLLGRSVGVDAKDDQGMTPFLYSVKGGYLESTKMLLQMGADINNRDNQGRTALHFAAQHGHYGLITEVLLGHGAEIDAETEHGNTPLQYAIRYSHGIIAKELLVRGARCQNLEEARILNEIEYFDDAKTKGDSATSRYLDQLVACELPEHHKTGPLHVAIAMGDVAEVKTLLKREKSASAVITPDGLTPLHLAVCCGKLAVAELLLGHGVKVDVKCNKGKTPLHYATEKGALDLVRVLIANGADINSKTAFSWTPLHLVLMGRYGKSVCDGLLLLNLLVDHGCNIEAKDKNGLTPLHYAARNCRLGMLRFLLSRCANVSATDDDERTPLHLSFATTTIGPEAVEAVELLLEYGSNMEAKDKNGQTPLQYAAQCGHVFQRILQTHGGAVDDTLGNEDEQEDFRVVVPALKRARRLVEYE